jgi:hypothetical protein
VEAIKILVCRSVPQLLLEYSAEMASSRLRRLCAI